MSGTVVRDGQLLSDSHVFEFGEQFAPRPQVEEPAASSAAAPIETFTAAVNAKPALPPALQPMTTAQLIRDLKHRLRFVEREIKARKALEKEREQIRRLIQAAKQNKATVHAIKRAAG